MKTIDLLQWAEAKMREMQDAAGDACGLNDLLVRPWEQITNILRERWEAEGALASVNDPAAQPHGEGKWFLCSETGRWYRDAHKCQTIASVRYSPQKCVRIETPAGDAF